MSNITSVSSVTRSSLYEYAGVLVNLDQVVANYSSLSQSDKINRARTLAQTISIMKDIERNGLVATDELRGLLAAVRSRAEPVAAVVNGGGSDAQIVAAMNTFIDNGSTTAASLINNALDPAYWQTNGVPISIRDSISDFAFFEYYRTADAVMASSLGALADRIQASENFLKAINNVYLGVTWNPGADYINVRGELQDKITTTGSAKTFQAFDGATWNDPTHYLATFAAANVNISSNTVTITGNSFSNGDQVYYNGPNGEAGGLISNQIYFIINKSGDSFQLTSKMGDSTPDYLIDLSSTGGSAQTLERYSFVNSGTDTIYLPSHGFTEGQALVYNSEIPISGLQTGISYYAKNVTTDTFQLATVSGGAAVDVSYGLGSERINAIQSFTPTGPTAYWYTKFQSDKVQQTMMDGITALRTMVLSGVLPMGSIERNIADQILAKWDTPYSSGGFGAISTSSAASRMWSDKSFKKIIEDGINGTSRLNEQSQLDLTRAMQNYDYFTRSATTFVTRESDTVKNAAQKIKMS